MSEESKTSSSESKDPETGRNLTSRSNQNETSRTTSRTDASIPQTFRTEMSTTRVHTVLAALTAEKQALLAKLNAIDNTLESEKKKNKNSNVPSNKTIRK